MNNTDREKLINWIRYTYVSNSKCAYKATVNDTADAVIADMLIANGVVVREKGEWRQHTNASVECPVCEGVSAMRSDFCPHCGADMRRR